MYTPENLALISIIGFTTLALAITLLIRNKNKQKTKYSDQTTAPNTLDFKEKSQNNSSYAASKAKLEAGYENDIKSQIEQIKRLPSSEIESHFLKLIKTIDIHKKNKSLSVSTCETLASLANLAKQERKSALMKTNPSIDIKTHQHIKNEEKKISKPKR